MVVYNLKKGISFEEYRKYSLEVDQPLINSLASVKEFNVYFVLGPEKIWDVFETILIDNWEEFDRETQIEKADKEWRQWIDEDSLKTIYGEKI
jgi:hypothetical protein